MSNIDIMMTEDTVKINVTRYLRKTTVSVKRYEKEGRKARYKVATTTVPGVERKSRWLWIRVPSKLPTWVVVAAPTSVNVKDGFLVGPRRVVQSILDSLSDLPVDMFDVAFEDPGSVRALHEEARRVTITLVEPWNGSDVKLEVVDGMEMGRWYSVDCGGITCRVMSDFFESFYEYGFSEEDAPPKAWEQYTLPEDYCVRMKCSRAWGWKKGDEIIIVQEERGEDGMPSYYIYWWRR